MKTQLVKISSLLLFIILSSQNVFAQKTGTVRGNVTDKTTGETLIGVNIVIEGTITGTVTDFDGNFNLLKIPSGKVNLVFSYISYATQTISEVEVKSGEVTVLNILLTPATEEIDEVVIVAKQLDNTESAILNMQKRAEGIQDGISSVEMKRYASSNAAESMTKVTGVSVVGGKNVVIRGLGDRYTNVQLDGQNLPSTDPYKNSADIDLIPSNLLDNIITSKTFIPDQPGNFTGGNVNIKTKSFPERFTLNFSIGTSYNTSSSLNKNFMTYDGGSTDWLGFDDGTRDIPKLLQPGLFRDSILINTNVRNARRYPYSEVGGSEIKYPNSIYGPTGEILGEKVGASAKALGGYQMHPVTKTAPLDQKISFSIGNQVTLFGKPLGLLFGANFKRTFKSYTGGTNNWYILNIEDKDGKKSYTMDPYYEFDNDSRSIESPQISGLGSIAYKFNKNGSAEFAINYTHDADKESRYQSGVKQAVERNREYHTRSLNFTERQLVIYRTTVTQVFSKLNNTKLEVNGSIIESKQIVPDLRFFANFYDPNGNEYQTIDASLSNPSHFWRDLNDNQKQLKADITIPILQEKSSSNKIKVGGFYSNKDRVYTEDQYAIKQNYSKDDNFQTLTELNGDVNQYFGGSNFGIVNTSSNISNYYQLGHLVEYSSAPDSRSNNDYSGYERITAAYIMGTFNILPKLKLIAGVRYEQTRMRAESEKYYTLGYADAGIDTLVGVINGNNFLPSVNLVYALKENMNLRGSFSQTLARPNMREMSPFSSFSFIGGPTETGNPNLKQSEITNIDFRWEWFIKPGELFAISAYHKNFKNPIIVKNVLVTDNNEITYDNVNSGKVYGVELELRKKLDFVQALKDLSFSGNVSITHSEMDVPEDEWEQLKLNPDFEKHVRQFNGQSPYLLNLNLNYTKDWFESTISYNKFGNRLSKVGGGKAPDIYEVSGGNLDFISKVKMGSFGISFYVKNILNSPYKQIQELQGVDYEVVNNDLGSTFSLTLSYSIN